MYGVGRHTGVIDSVQSKGSLYKDGWVAKGSFTKPEMWFRTLEKPNQTYVRDAWSTSRF